MSNRVKGIICILFSAAGFSVMNLLIPLAGPIPTIQKTFFRNLVALLVASYLLIKKHHKAPIKEFTNWQEIPWLALLLRVTLGTIGVVCNYYALDHLMISDASVLNKLAPFATLVFSAIFLKENITKTHIIALLFAFVGVLFVVKPTMNFTVLMPYLVGILGGINAGGAYTSVRYLNNKGVTSAFIVFAFSLFSCLIFAPYLISNYQPMTLRALSILIGVGLAATIGQFGITYAYKFAPASEISIFDYSAIIFTGLLGWILLSQIPDYWSIIGYIIIFLSTLMTFIYNQRQAKLICQNDKDNNN